MPVWEVAATNANTTKECMVRWSHIRRLTHCQQLFFPPSRARTSSEFRRRQVSHDRQKESCNSHPSTCSCVCPYSRETALYSAPCVVSYISAHVAFIENTKESLFFETARPIILFYAVCIENAACLRCRDLSISECPAHVQISYLYNVWMVHSFA